MMTGPEDYISDGQLVFKLSNGNALLGSITASGCIVGTSIATFCAVANHSGNEDLKSENGRPVKGNMLAGAIAGFVPS